MGGNHVEDVGNEAAIFDGPVAGLIAIGDGGMECSPARRHRLEGLGDHSDQFRPC
jgi:hypothetical protein